MRFFVFTFLLLAALAPAKAQDGIYVAAGDTIVYRYTPVDSVRLSAQQAERKPFFRRVIDYFGTANEDKTFRKKIDFSFILGPSYTKNTNFSLGGLAAGLYRLDRTDSITPPSDVSIYGNVSVTGFYSLGVRGNNIFRNGRNRIVYRAGFLSQPTDFWGTGYDAGAYNPASHFVAKRVNIEARYLYRLVKNTFVGATLSLEHTQGIKFTEPSYLNGARTHYTAGGIGLVAEYDSRDFIPNASRGLYVSMQETFYPKGLGNCGLSIWNTVFTADYYQRVWKGGVVAFDLYGEFNTDGTPWSMMALLGDSNRMRGYYEGRYMDNDLVTVQVELRQNIWRRIGCTVWAGAGNVFPAIDKFSWGHTLPNYGVGLRWEFKNRVNVRIDYGFGRHTSGLVFNINEAF